MTDAVSEQPSKDDKSPMISEEDVIAFLRDNPKFLAKNPESEKKAA